MAQRIVTQVAFGKPVFHQGKTPAGDYLHPLRRRVTAVHHTNA
jgi:hypothetical protein